jgi:Rap1a immunity proteins
MKQAMRKLILVGVAVAALAGPALTDDAVFTGDKLFSYCTGGGDYGEGACTGYINGVSAGLRAAGLVCEANTVTFGQEHDIVVKFLSDHPELQHMPAYGLTTAAMIQAFPCPTNRVNTPK